MFSVSPPPIPRPHDAECMDSVAFTKLRAKAAAHQNSVMRTFALIMQGTNGEQQDAHEFLLHILNCLVECKNQPDAKRIVKVTKAAFLQQYAVAKTCTNCKHKSRSVDETHLVLTLPMTTTIQVGIDEFVTSHIRMTCEHCDKLTDVMFRRIVCKRHPRYMFIHIARFAYYPTAMKIDTPIRVENVVKMCGKSYVLKGFVVHSGSMTSGHFIAIVRVQNNRWFVCNDMFVSPISRIDMLKQLPKAYLLLYSATPSHLDHSFKST